MIGKGLAGLASILGLSSMLPSDNVPSDNVNPIMTQESEKEAPLPKVKPDYSKSYSEEREAPLPKVKPPVPNDLDVALSIAEEKGKGTPSDIYDKVLKPIAYHESDKTMNPKLEQYGGGPGRGLMQFEPNSMKTALTRAKNIFDNNPPSWIKKAIDEKNYDASTLTADQQMALAVYDLLEKKEADISKVTKGEQSIEDFWSKYWWAGKEKDKKTRLKVFKKNLNSLNNNKKQGGSIVERNPYNYQPKAI
ncbi:MAG: hypothetical protein S4CHLAM20_02160 [Chlamydiia bacterium]|nr:hypothetical protein [Chlamydiia bacterium]